MFFSCRGILADNHRTKVKPDTSLNYLIRSRWISVPIVALIFLTAPGANPDPVGDFFKKVGQSVSKAFQPQPSPVAKKKTRSNAQSAARESNGSETEPTSVEGISKAAKEEKAPATVLPALAVPAEKARDDMPYGIPVPGRKGLVTSPYLPEGNYVDVSVFPSGSAVKDPNTGKIFRVP